MLVIDQKRLNVSKDVNEDFSQEAITTLSIFQLLSINSSVFTALFFNGFSEKEKEEIELKEIDYDVAAQQFQLCI